MKDWREVPRLFTRIHKVAIHEAGHAIGFHLEGFGARMDLDFSDPEMFWGHTEVVPRDWYILQPPSEELKAQRARAEVFGALAGPSADGWNCMLRRPRLSRADRVNLDAACIVLKLSSREKRTFIAEQRNRADALWLRREYQETLSRLARALMEKESLTDYEVRQIIENTLSEIAA